MSDNYQDVEPLAPPSKIAGLPTLGEGLSPAPVETPTAEVAPKIEPLKKAKSKKTPTKKKSRSKAAKEANALLDLSALFREQAIVSDGGVDNPMLSLDDELSTFGIELTNNLVLQYVTGANILPMGRVISLVGKPGSGKTQLSWYFARLVLQQSGFVNVYDTEGRPSGELETGVLQESASEAARYRLGRMYCKSIEALQRRIGDITGALVTACSKKNIWPPILSVIDSMSNVTSEDSMQQTQSEGNASTGFTGARNANCWGEFLKQYVPTYISYLPYILVLVNHQKGKIAESAGGGRESMVDRHTGSGGSHKDFNSSLTIEVSKKSTTMTTYSDPEWPNAEKTPVTFLALKTGMGAAHRKCEVNVYSYREEGVKIISHDWDSALIDLLFGERTKISTTLAREVTGIENAGNTAYWCEPLGISKDEAVTKREMGQLLQQDKKMVARLRSEVLDIGVFRTYKDATILERTKAACKERFSDRKRFGSTRKEKKKKKK